MLSLAVEETWGEFFFGRSYEGDGTDPWGDGFADYIIVFPVMEHVDFVEKEAFLPMDPADPKSVAAQLKQIIVDEEFFDPRVKPGQTEDVQIGAADGDFVDVFSGMISGMGSSSKRAATVQDLDETGPVATSETEENTTHSKQDLLLHKAYIDAKECNVTRTLKTLIVELVLRFLVCSHCGFAVRAFSSVDRDELFVAISAEDEVLKAHAHQLQYKVQLDPELEANLLEADTPFREVSPPFVAYDKNVEKLCKKQNKGRSPYKTYTDVTPHGSIFRGVDRIRIIKAVIDRAFRLGVMQNLGFVTCFYPAHNRLGKLLGPGALHRRDPKLELSKEWANLRKVVSADIPLDMIRDYYGEGHTFRFLQLSFMTRLIFPVAAVVPIILIVKYFTSFWKWAELFTGMMLVVWTSLYHEFYNREEVAWSLRWGMDDFLKTEATRPEFQGTRWVKSPVDHHTIVKEDEHALTNRMIATFLTFFFIGCSLMTTAGLYVWMHHLEVQDQPTQIVMVLITAEVVILKFIWYYVAEWLTDYENWEMESEYFEALVYRIFYFQFINSFASLFYLGLFKNIDSYRCDAEECDGEAAFAKALAHQLRFLFGTNVFMNALTVLTPLLTYWYRITFEDSSSAPQNGSHDETRALAVAPRTNSTSSNGSFAPGKQAKYSWQEKQAKLPPYLLNDEIWERIDVIVELGYVLFFGFVAPEIIFLFLLNNLIRIRAMGWVLVNTFLRPFPRKASGIGYVFHSVYSFMLRVAVMSNVLLLLVYNAASSEKDDIFLWLKRALANEDESVERVRDWKSMMAVFLVLDGAISLFSYGIRVALPDERGEVLLLKQRREMTVLKFENSLSNVDDSQVLKKVYRKMHKDFKKVHTLRRGQWGPEDPHLVAPGRAVPRWNDMGGIDPWFVIPD